MVCGLILGMVGLNCITYNLYPTVWCDEVTFSEPAINLARFHSFTTIVWQNQPPDTFFAANCPLYSLLLALWLMVTGTDLLAIRSLNYLLMGVVLLLLWRASWIFKLVPTSRARLLLLLALGSGYGMSFAFRCSRPDMLGALSILLVLFALGHGPGRLRPLSLVLAGALTVWVGLQVALFVCFSCAVGWLLVRKSTLGTRLPRLGDFAFLAGGISVGFAALLALFAYKGRLGDFLSQLSGILGRRYLHRPQVSGQPGLQQVLIKSIGSSLDDLSTTVLVGGLILTLFAAGKQIGQPVRALLIYSLLLAFGLPFFFNAAGHYMFYYSYMRFIPVALAFFATYSEIYSNMNRPLLTRSLLLIALMAIVVGLPMRLSFSAAFCNLVPRRTIQKIVSTNIHAEDIVFCDFAAFFEAKQVSPVVYDAMSSSALLSTGIEGAGLRRDFSSVEKRSVSVMVIPPDSARFLQEFFGGEWQAVTEPFGDSQNMSALARIPLIGGKLAHYPAGPQTKRYPLQIFRRKDVLSPSGA